MVRILPILTAWVLGSLSCLTTSTQQSPVLTESTNSTVSDQDYTVYAAALKHFKPNCICFTILEHTGHAVGAAEIDEILTTSPASVFAGLLPSLLATFETPQRLEDRMASGVRMHLPWHEPSDTGICQTVDSLSQDSEPKSCCQLFQVSRVVYDLPQAHALLTVDQYDGGGIGHGGLVFLTLSDDAWIVSKTFESWTACDS